MAEYTRRYRTVEAEQFKGKMLGLLLVDGYSRFEMRVGHPVNEDSGIYPYLTVELDDGSEVTLRPGDWLIKDGDHWFGLPESQFRQLFYPAETSVASYFGFQTPMGSG